MANINGLVEDKMVVEWQTFIWGSFALVINFIIVEPAREPSAPLSCCSTQNPSLEKVLGVAKPWETPALFSLAFV